MEKNKQNILIDQYMNLAKNYFDEYEGIRFNLDLPEERLYICWDKNRLKIGDSTNRRITSEIIFFPEKNSWNLTQLNFNINNLTRVLIFLDLFEDRLEERKVSTEQNLTSERNLDNDLDVRRIRNQVSEFKRKLRDKRNRRNQE